MLWKHEVQAKEQVEEKGILDKAESFARLLRSSPEFEAYLTAQQEMKRDSEAQKAIRDFQAMEQSLQTSRFLGGIKQSELDRLKHLRKVMLENPAVKAFLKAQEELVVLFQETSRIISQIVEMDYGAACAPAGGCC